MRDWRAGSRIVNPRCVRVNRGMGVGWRAGQSDCGTRGELSGLEDGRIAELLVGAVYRTPPCEACARQISAQR